MSPADYDHVDLAVATDLMNLLSARLRSAHGSTIPPREYGRARSAELAKLTKELLFISHLARKVEIAVMDEYYITRGETDHLESD